MDTLEFHRRRYAGEFLFDELRWSRIGPCLRMVQEERRRQRRSLTVLDVGCGDGSVSRLFLDAGHKVLGIDMVPEFAAKAVERGIAALAAHVTSNGLPFCEAAVDVVYAGALLEHLYDPEFFLGECRRVLTAGGIIVVSTPNIASLTSRLRMLFGGGPSTTPLL